jgi:hypothetical protein
MGRFPGLKPRAEPYSPFVGALNLPNIPYLRAILQDRLRFFNAAFAARTVLIGVASGIAATNQCLSSCTPRKRAFFFPSRVSRGDAGLWLDIQRHEFRQILLRLRNEEVFPLFIPADVQTKSSRFRP